MRRDMISVGVLYRRALNCYRERYLLVTVRADIMQTQGAGLVAMTDPVDRQFIRQSVSVRTESLPVFGAVFGRAVLTF